MADAKKPRKPYPTFPLTPRKDGRFAKKIKGIYYAFGSGGDWQKALDEYHRVAAEVHSGRPIPDNVPEIITVRQCANRYLDEREKEAKAGTLTWGSWDDYRDTLTRFARFVGPTLRIAQLRPDDFMRFGHHLTGKAKLGAYAYNRSRALIHAWLKFAARSEWITPVNTGAGFKKISVGKIRAEKKLRLFTPAQVKSILAAAKPQMKAMVYLGLNGGMGAKDIATLTRDRIDLEAKVIRHPRAKTNIARTVTLWPETVNALKPLLIARPDDPLVFRTKHGMPWVRETKKGKTVINKDSVTMQFRKILEAIGLKSATKMAGVGFYTCRHTFSTYSNEVRDSDARLHLMGRKLPGIDGDTYMEAIFLPRLKVVTDHVRSRVLKGR